MLNNTSRTRNPLKKLEKRRKKDSRKRSKRKRMRVKPRPWLTAQSLTLPYKIRPVKNKASQISLRLPARIVIKRMIIPLIVSNLLKQKTSCSLGNL